MQPPLVCRTHAMQRLQTRTTMPFSRPQPTRAWISRAWLCLLWLGLMLQGQTELQRRVLGAAHAHVLPAAHAQATTPHAHHADAGHHAHTHHHDHSERHHHGHGDDTVVALEPLHDADGSASEAGFGSLLQPLALAGGLGWCPPAGAAHGCPPATVQRWRSASLRQPERPPRA